MRRPAASTQAATAPDLQERRRAALLTARQLLGDGGGAASATLEGAIDALVRRLEADGDGGAASEQEVHRRRVDVLRGSAREPFADLRRVRAAVERLAASTRPAAMLAAAPGELVTVAEVRRAIVSSVRDGMLTAEAAACRDDSAAAAAIVTSLQARPVRLAHRLVETAVVRRRLVTAVPDATRDAGVHRGMLAVMAWGGYVVAPVVAGGTVIALLHADRGPGSPVSGTDRVLVSAFAAELGRAYETASLRRGLREEREQIGQLLEWLGARSRELAVSDVRLTPPVGASRRPQGAPGAAAGRGQEDILVFDGLLTRRELEVLRLLRDGLTNGAIADRLVISTGTVKSHVNSLFAKLHVGNRAEAVARYYALMQQRRRA